MSTDEDDYMSDSFLAKCVPDKNDIKPGLIRNRAEKRQFDLTKKRHEDNERLKRLKMTNSQAAIRERGLQKPIGSDNKGFSLLQKMGYKPGQGIGKSESGNTQPIPINVKSDRSGLGKATAQLEKIQRIEKACDVNAFRTKIREQVQEKQTMGDLIKSQHACEKLDMDSDIVVPNETWFWPPKPKTVDEDDSDSEPEEDNLTPIEKLTILTKYLKENHLYCIWCGAQFEDAEDLMNQCPGPTRDDH